MLVGKHTGLAHAVLTTAQSEVTTVIAMLWSDKWRHQRDGAFFFNPLAYPLRSK